MVHACTPFVFGMSTLYPAHYTEKSQLVESLRLEPIPRTMYNNCSINRGSQRHDPKASELEETYSSSRSSFADLWDSSIPVEIRDGSYQTGVFNPTSTVLQMCHSQVMVPYFLMLSVIGWRPFCRDSLKCRGLWHGLNILYTLIIFLLLLFSYVSSIIACQARLDVTARVTVHTTMLPTHIPTTPHNKSTPHPTTASNSTHNATTPPLNISTTVPPSNPYTTAKTTGFPAIAMFTLATARPEWRPTECTHMLSAYIVPNFLHFLAFVMGFYHYRVQESEGLHALIEMVFLQSKIQTKIVKRLRSFLILGVVWLLVILGSFILFCYSFNLPSVTGFRNSVRQQWVAACLMVLGNLVEVCVTFAIIVNYCAQCQLLIYYLGDIALRIEEKTAELGHLMKDLWEVKKYLRSLNGVTARITTLVIFNYCELAVIGLCILFMEPRDVPTSQLVYRSIVPVVCLLTLICPLAMSALVTSSAHSFKQRSLQVRVFGYPSTTQFDRDSFLLFIQNMDLKAKLFFIPMKSSYLWGFSTMVLFIILLLMQTSTLAGNNKYI